MLEKPFVRIVAEITLDGKTTLGCGKSSRALFAYQDPDLKLFTHEQRSHFDAILVGAETIRTDNPFLTIRGFKTVQPVRIVISKSCKFPSNSNIFDGSSKTIIVVPRSIDQKKVKELENYPVQIVYCGNAFVNLNELMNSLSELNIKRLIIEGGGCIIEQFIKENLVDEILIKQIPIFVGGENTPNLLGDSADLGGRKLTRWKLKQLKAIGDHVVKLYER